MAEAVGLVLRRAQLAFLLLLLLRLLRNPVLNLLHQPICPSMRSRKERDAPRQRLGDGIMKPPDKIMLFVHLLSLSDYCQGPHLERMDLSGPMRRFVKLRLMVLLLVVHQHLLMLQLMLLL